MTCILANNTILMIIDEAVSRVPVLFHVLKSMMIEQQARNGCATR